MRTPLSLALLLVLCAALFLSPVFAPAPLFAGEEPGKTLIFLPSGRNGTHLSRIFFSSTGATDDSQIHSIDPDGTGRKQLTSTEGNNDVADVSPDGRLVLFTSTRSGSADVWIMNNDGSDQRMIFGGSTWEYAEDFSPDGSRILFASNRNGYFQNFIMNVDGSGLVALPRDAGGYWAQFSPDGERIVYSALTEDTGNAIFLMDVDGSNIVQLTSLEGEEQFPLWSPDGSKIYFKRASNAPNTEGIWSIGVDGAHLERVLDHGIARAVSPDGKQLLLSSDPDLFTMVLGTQQTVNVTNTPYEVESTAAWGVTPR